MNSHRLPQAAPDYMSSFEVLEIEQKIDALLSSCDVPPIASYIIELGREFDDRGKAGACFDVTMFRKKLTDLKSTIEFEFNKVGIDREKAFSGYFYNRMIFEVHNTTTFKIRYFSCKDLANAFIGRTKDEFKLAKVFNSHHEIVHTPYF